MAPKPGIRVYVFASVLVLFGLAACIALAEVVARYLEPETVVHGRMDYTPHATLGWLSFPGKVSVVTHEYEAHYDVNGLQMHDDNTQDSIKLSKFRILVLGDSHTFAIGVSRDEAWPNVLERNLFNGDKKAGTVHNAAVAGYSLGQYLLRMRLLMDEVKPHVILVGFSMATDLYDLIPPSRGGFVYGADRGRVYFDLDDAGNLVELHDLEGKDLAPSLSTKQTSASLSIRRIAENFALYRRLKRSKLAMWVAMNIRPNNESLWPGLDTSLKRDLSGDDSYRWNLAEKILQQLAREASKKNAEVVLVNIPYIAQVYDDVWNSSFGSKPDRYERWLAGERLQEICARAGIGYLDTTRPFVDEARTTAKWLHHREDAHPNADGQRFIARLVSEHLKRQGIVH